MAVAGCKYLRPEQKIESEATMENPNAPLSDAQLWLNSEEVGLISEMNRKWGPDDINDPKNIRTTQSLKGRLKNIFQERAKNGVFDEGSNDVTNDVYVVVSPKLQIDRFAALHTAITAAGGEVRIPKKPLDQTEFPSEKPNPLFLAISDRAQLFPYGLSIVALDDQGKFSYSTEVVFVQNPIELKIARIRGSVEISADDNYFVNEKVNVMPDSNSDIVDVKQRAISVTDLQTELSNIGPGGTKLQIVASEKASYASLLKVFEAAEKLNSTFEIMVRRHDLKSRR